MESLGRQTILHKETHFQVISMSIAISVNLPNIIISSNEKWLLKRIEQKGHILSVLVGAERYRLEDLGLIQENDDKIILTTQGQQYIQSI